MHVCTHTCVCACMWVQCPGRPEEGTEPLQQELQIIVSHPVWVLERELRFSGRSVHSLKGRAGSAAPAPHFWFYFIVP